jgi:hypothetical protein
MATYDEELVRTSGTVEVSARQGQSSLMASFMSSLETNAIEPIRQALQSLDAVELLEFLLRSGDKKLTAGLSNDSYVHANGFYKVTLPFTPTSTIRVRLHVWPDDSCADQAPDPHNHKYPFVSRVLAGGLSHNIMDIRRGTGGYQHFKYVRKDNGHRYLSAGRAALDVMRIAATPAGVTYTMDAQTVHMVQPERFAYAATVVVELARARNHTDVFVEDGVKPEGVTVVPTRLRPEQVETILCDILTKIKQPSRKYTATA